MCGLAGRFHPDGLPDAPDWHARASALLAHRGPDGQGHFRDGHSELVHRRLALLDLTPTGHQPMGNEDGSVLVVFNGEIYNHRELRRLLEARGHRFRGTADTEVLVHLYEEHGDALVDRLRGIFAFALYDRRRRRLLLARDRFGVKPLFYTDRGPGGQWVFGSELKALLALPGVPARVDRQACYDFLGLGYVPEPATGFADLRALPPGTRLAIDERGSTLDRYHQIRAEPDPARRIDTTVGEVAEALTEAVDQQASADVPVATLLSGGIDSSLVLAARCRTGAAAPATFNVRFPDPGFDETALARAVAARWGTHHHTVDAPTRQLEPDPVFALMRHFDQPFADTSLLPMFWVASLVRSSGIRCTLAGDGGDEAFGGYSTFWRANRLSALMRSPGWLRRALGDTGRALAGRTRDWGRQLAKAADLAEAGRTDSAALLAGVASYLSEGQKEALVRPEARAGLAPADRLFDGYPERAALTREELSRRVTEKLFAVSLPSDMLRKVDMMSMRASVEVRVPLLDERVVGIGLSLPHRLKTDGRQGKLALRALARRWLPREVARHPKRGFAIPLDVMVPPAFHAAAADLLAGSDALTRPVVDRTLVHTWLAAFAKRGPGGGGGGDISRAGLYQRVFMLLALELWLREHRVTW